MTRDDQRLERFLCIAAACVPAALYVIYVWHYSFNLPFGDDWTKMPLVVAALRNHIDFGQVWDQHTEARLVVPNLVFVIVGRPIRFNIQVIVLVGASSLIASYFVLLRLARDYVARPPGWLLILVLGVVWFSLVDTGNSLWAFQLAWYLVIFFLMAMLYFLLAWPYRRRVGLALATLAAVCGSFSMVQGFLLWPVGVLCIAWSFERTRVLALGVWIGAAAVTAGTYFFHYELGKGCTEGTHCSLDAPLRDPVHYGKFFAALVGYVVPKVGPFGRDAAGLHQVIGLLLLAGAAIVVVQSLREWRSRDRPPLVLAIVLFALLFDLTLMITRGGGRVVLAAQSRFTMPNIMLVAAFVLFAWAHPPRWTGEGDRTRRDYVQIAAAAALGLFVLLLAVFTTRTGIEEGRSWHRIQVTEARVLVNGRDIPRPTSHCYLTTFVTNGSRRSRSALIPVLRNVAAARRRKLYVFQKDRLETYRKLGPPEVPFVCQLPSATNIIPQARG